MGNRIFYAIQRAGIRKFTDSTFAVAQTVKGVQSVGMNTNFNLSQIFEYGQISIYENIEDLPDIEVSLTRVLDGNPLAYHLATVHDGTANTPSPTLAGRSNGKCTFGLGIYPDSSSTADGVPTSEVICSGMFVQSLAYRIPLADNSTEELTLVGNHKVWVNDPRVATGQRINSFSFSGNSFGGTSTGSDVPAAAVGVARRQDVSFNIVNGSAVADSNGMFGDYDCTILPPEIPGISSSGLNIADSVGNYAAHLQSINVTANLGRDAINELGHRAPYTRFVQFPLEVTTEIQVTSVSGDYISATDLGILTTGTGCGSDKGNLTQRTIRVALCEGTRLYMGLKNKLKSVTYNGGDTGGGNVNVTYTYSNFNDLTVIHSGDPHPSAWYTSRSGYLVN